MRIGILGAGQLGQMLALAGYPLGQRFTFLDTSGSPSAEIGTTLLSTQTDNQLESFCNQVDLVTYEFEHLPLNLVQQLEQQKPVFPSSKALAVCQNRGLEKALFNQLNIPTPEYQLVTNAQQLETAVSLLINKHSKPVVIKTVTDGYDGKGQAVVKQLEGTDFAQIWAQLGQKELIVETFINFVREVSIIAVRSTTGELAFYPMAENHHVDGILRYSIAPLPNLSTATSQKAQEYISALLNELNYVGVLTLELFEQADGQLLANEMAPRVHNSGHWTQEGAVTCQFENHLRALSGLPLGSTAVTKPTCMLNLIGKNADYAQLLKHENLHLHLYGKEERSGRKIGHLNLQAASVTELAEQVMQLAQQLPDAPLPKFSFIN